MKAIQTQTSSQLNLLYMNVQKISELKNEERNITHMHENLLNTHTHKTHNRTVATYKNVKYKVKLVTK